MSLPLTGIKLDTNTYQETFGRQEAAGKYVSAQYAEVGFTPCTNGVARTATDTFKCRNVSYVQYVGVHGSGSDICKQIDLYHFLSHSALGSTRGFGSSSWGWTSSTGREFVAIGQSDGTAFAEVSSEGKLIYLGRLPQYSSVSQWREIRGHRDYMIIGSEAQGHGIQIFDMKKVETSAL